jgi:hypothetical protein
MDSLHLIEGHAPPNEVCKVEIISTATGQIKRTEFVRGTFRVGYVAGGPAPSTVDIAVWCNDKSVRHLRSVNPRSTGSISLGEL